MAIKNFIEELEWRGMIHTIMPGAKEQLEKEMTTAYPVSYTHLTLPTTPYV